MSFSYGPALPSLTTAINMPDTVTLTVKHDDANVALCMDWNNDDSCYEGTESDTEPHIDGVSGSAEWWDYGDGYWMWIFSISFNNGNDGTDQFWARVPAGTTPITAEVAEMDQSSDPSTFVSVGVL